MMNVNTLKLAEWAGGTCEQTAIIQGVKVDSRLIEPGDLYVCLRGERVDGHDYVFQALEKGAAAIMCDRYLAVDCAQILVEDTLQALFQCAGAYRETLSAIVIGITGSNGKTSTKDALYAILSHCGQTVATYKNQNTEIGTCLNLFRMDETVEYAVLEFGLEHPGEIANMAAIAKPHAAIVTSFAPAHLTHFENQEAIAHEKFSIFNNTLHQDWCFYQGDFAVYRNLATTQHSFGFNAENEYHVSDISLSNEGVSFAVNGVHYKTNLLGAHQASNAAGIIALSHALGIEEPMIRLGLQEVALTELRTEVLMIERATVIMDAYKSNPVSAYYALDLLSGYHFSKDRYAVLGDMLDLGEKSVAMHRDILDMCASLDLKKVIALGENFLQAKTGSRLEDDRFEHAEDFESLQERVNELFSQECLILIKGSRKFKLERLIERG